MAKREGKRLLLLCVLLIGVAMLAMSGVQPVLAAGDPDFDPPLAPLGPVPVPLDNPITPEKVELGKLLFFDPKITGDASLSCGSCHNPQQGWGFADSISRGYPGTVHWRNSQTVVNTGYYGKLFWQGNVNSLEAQAQAANTGGVAGNGKDDVMEERLRQTPEYRQMFQKVFGGSAPQLDNAWKAIAAFERAMLSQTNTPLDLYLKGEKDALSSKAIKGLELFNGKANCIECHNGSLLSDEKYYNLGVPRAAEWLEVGLNQITFRFQQYSKGGVFEEMYRSFKDDAGLYYNTNLKEDMGKFRTPSLRYIKYTAPYMHNGTFFTLKEVIDFYDQGGGQNEFTDGTHGASTKTTILKPLNLTGEEKEALVAFLEELSGEEITIGGVAVPDYAPFPDVETLTQQEAKRIGLEDFLAH
ncbi:MAG: cytochrome-c peroxidase [Candidatus Tectomicrobia bacterium]|nr:cytochrome-c peroxidase [Candidatus Tectomicrobia bacterium]